MTREEKGSKGWSDLLNRLIHNLLTSAREYLSTLMHFESNPPAALLWMAITFLFPLLKAVWLWLAAQLRHLSRQFQLSTGDLNLPSFRLVMIFVALREITGPCKHHGVHSKFYFKGVLWFVCLLWKNVDPEAECLSSVGQLNSTKWAQIIKTVHLA